jgi:hypothetical protein
MAGAAAPWDPLTSPSRGRKPRCSWTNPSTCSTWSNGKEELLRRCDILKYAEQRAASAAAHAQLAAGLTAADLWAAPFVLKALVEATASESDALREWAIEASGWDALLARSLRGLSNSLAAVSQQAQQALELAQGFVAAERGESSARNGAVTAA